MPITLEAGTLLRERYDVRQIIGRGGMGSIYLAEDARLPGRLCAVKEVQQDPDLPEYTRLQGREQFYQEASVLARLDHPNLPKVSDYFSEGERDYLVMDYVPGDDLKTLMDQARREGRFLPSATVLDWAVPIPERLEARAPPPPPPSLYHMLGNQPPAEAKERFLHPESLRPIRQLNPEVPLGLERAILWALALHPDERPPDAA